jgi:hypothetical protein
VFRRWPLVGVQVCPEGRDDPARPPGCSGWHRARDRGEFGCGSAGGGPPSKRYRLAGRRPPHLVSGRHSDRLVRVPLAAAARSPCGRQLQHPAGHLHLGCARQPPPPAREHSLQRALLQRLQRPTGPARLGGADAAPRRQRPEDLQDLDRPEAKAPQDRPRAASGESRSTGPRRA